MIEEFQNQEISPALAAEMKRRSKSIELNVKYLNFSDESVLLSESNVVTPKLVGVLLVLSVVVVLDVAMGMRGDNVVTFGDVGLRCIVDAFEWGTLSTGGVLEVDGTIRGWLLSAHMKQVENNNCTEMGTMVRNFLS
uniref:Uncharacterized protein n=1 Tax=Romanomermis culicivorax TaxID=13658 RepID=A0A915K7V4_ROMCU